MLTRSALLVFSHRARPRISPFPIHTMEELGFWDVEDGVQGQALPVPLLAIPSKSLSFSGLHLSCTESGALPRWPPDLSSLSPWPVEVTVPLPGRLCLQGHRLLAINISAIPGLSRVFNDCQLWLRPPPPGEIRAVPVPTWGEKGDAGSLLIKTGPGQAVEMAGLILTPHPTHAQHTGWGAWG